MKLGNIALFGALAAVLLAGCGGGVDRTVAARDTVKTYWYNIDHAKFKQAYDLITSGTRAARAYTDYSQDMLAFLGNAGTINVKVGSPKVSDDQATVPLVLSSPRSSQQLHAYQHLYWENGGWKISDQNGGVSQTP